MMIRRLTPRFLASLKYHDIFDYPLSDAELKKWTPGNKVRFKTRDLRITRINNFYFLRGKERIIKKRIQREKYSKSKMQIAHLAGSLLARVPTVKMVGVTGALAMHNASLDSDIDLMITTSQGALWITRLIAYFLLLIAGFNLRRYGIVIEKDKLCLNMWMDESDLELKTKDRNIFTAHEIAQIIPLVNKNKTYERLLWENRWILEYWPNAAGVSSMQHVVGSKGKNKMRATFYLLLATVFEALAFKLQYLYMKPRITREVITPTRAFFHPRDWSKKVLDMLA